MSRRLRPMKPRSPLTPGKPLALTAALLGVAFACVAGQTHTNAPAGPVSVATNAPPPLPQISQSVFIIPTTPQEGKDPFFPRSMRLFTDVVVRTNSQPVAAAITVELKLNGISGIEGRRLAIINNHSFAIDEEGEVTSNAGRVRIICKDIKADSVRVLVSGEERVLRLRAR
jgi:hypothetical protein